MSTDKPLDPFAGAAFDFPAGGDPFAGSSPFGSGAAVPAFESVQDMIDQQKRSEQWDQITEEALGEAGDDPEALGKRVLGEVEQAFKDRAQAEQKRYEQAVDSEFWIALVFQTRAQKDEFLAKCGCDKALMGDKYIEGPDFAKLIGKPVDPVAVRYNISDKLDRRLTELSRGLDELSGLPTPEPNLGG